MALSVSDCIAHIKHTLGGDLEDPFEALSPVSLINDAGEWLVSARNWRWLQGAMVQMDFVAGQAFVEMPSDFRSITAVETTNALTTGFQLTTMETLLQRRTHSINIPHWFWGAIRHEGGDRQSPPRVLLEIWPTPESDESDALSMFYVAGWRPVLNDDDYIGVPTWMETLFKQILRAFARGYEEEDVGSLDSRLTEIRVGVNWNVAVQRDVEQQREVGVLNNGIGSEVADRTAYWRGRVVGNPTG